MIASRFSRTASDGAERLVTAWRSVRGQPGWVQRVALVAFLLVLAVPAFVLLFIALVVATLVFGILALVHRVSAQARGLLPRRDGRWNVVVRGRRNDR